MLSAKKKAGLSNPQSDLIMGQFVEELAILGGRTSARGRLLHVLGL